MFLRNKKNNDKTERSKDHTTKSTRTYPSRPTEEVTEVSRNQLMTWTSRPTQILNLPFMHLLEDKQNILLAGAGGGFDIYAGLPIYFTLRQLGKNVHLANYTFMDFLLAKSAINNAEQAIETVLMKIWGDLKVDIDYYPEGYLAEWFHKNGEDVPVWLFSKSGVQPLKMAYEHLIKELDIDAIILLDGGVDSLMRGNEAGPGTLAEDSITLAAVKDLPVDTKILACLGFGTEIEESLDHYRALENIADLTKLGGFYGTCSLIPQLTVFQAYESACRYAWEKRDSNHKSHISTRVIPAANGIFGIHQMYPDRRLTSAVITPLMSQYWCFNADTVVSQNLLIDLLLPTYTSDDAYAEVMRFVFKYRSERPRKNLVL